MNFNCENFSLWYPSLKEGKMSVNRQEQALVHLTECSTCRLKSETIEEVLNDKIRPDADPIVQAAILSSLQASVSAKPFSTRVEWIPFFRLAAAGVAAVIAGYFAGHILSLGFENSDPKMISLIAVEYHLEDAPERIGDHFFVEP